MAEIIAKFETKYLFWSETCDRPSTSLMTLAELRTFVLRNSGIKGLRDLPERLVRVEQHGTSSRSGLDVNDLLKCNRAGPAGQRVATVEEMVRLYDAEQAGAGEDWSPRLDLTKPMLMEELYGGGTAGRVKEVLAVRGEDAVLLLEMQGEPEPVALLVDLQDGEIFNKGYQGFFIRNVAELGAAP